MLPLIRISLPAITRGVVLHPNLYKNTSIFPTTPSHMYSTTTFHTILFSDNSSDQPSSQLDNPIQPFHSNTDTPSSPVDVTLALSSHTEMLHYQHDDQINIDKPLSSIVDSFEDQVVDDFENFVDDDEELDLFKSDESEGDNFFESMNSINVAPSSIDDSLFQEQIQLEALAVERAVERYRQKTTQATMSGAASGLYAGQSLAEAWFQPLVDAIVHEFALIKNQVPGLDRVVYGPLLTLLSPEKLAVIALHQTISEILSHSSRITNADQVLDINTRLPFVRFTAVTNSIGRAVQAEINQERLDTVARPEWERARKLHTGHVNITFVNIQAKRILTDPADWTSAHTNKVGSALVGLLMKTLTIIDPESSEEFHAFERSDYQEAGKTIAMLKAHDLFFRYIDESHALREVFPPRYLPMIVPPRDWNDPYSGGYQTPSHNSPIIRTKGLRKQMDRVNERAEMGELGVIYQGLNTLSSVPWNINSKILKIVERAWNELNGDFADLPPRTAVKEPEPLTDAERQDIQTVRQHAKNLRKAQVTNRNMHSQGCDVELKLEVASRFEGKPIFFPHNLDFRGRAYPIPPHLNHMGNDLCRSMLMFDEKLPLGKDGLYWLKIHLANVYGQDKLSFDGRIAWVDSHWDEITESAANPLDGSRWWAKGESPWQSLASIFELTQAVGADGIHNPFNPNAPSIHVDRISEYECRLPVHMDGSCNGLAHYSALGRDSVGAEWVNMVPRERPQDVYTQVAKEVQVKVAAASQAGLPVAQLLEGHVKRKVIKQTVMTSVYGVTLIGARLQIQARLKDIHLEQQVILRSMDEKTAQSLTEQLDTWRQYYLSRGGIYHSSLAAQKGKVSPEDGTDSLVEQVYGAPDSENPIPTRPQLDGLPLLHEDDLYQMARFLATTTLDSLGEMFSGARNTMAWLADCASIISKSGHDVEWTTPLGLPVVQPYRRSRPSSIITVMHALTLRKPDESPVASARQRSAFPPNFVHSLDGTHMLMTCLAATEVGLTFAAVHDSFWTHPCHIPILNTILRKQFVDLHTQPLLENLRQEFSNRFPNLNIPPPPEGFDFDLNNILDSDYFFA